MPSWSSVVKKSVLERQIWVTKACRFAVPPDRVKGLIDRMAGHKVELRDQPVVVDMPLRNPLGQIAVLNVSLMLYRTQQVQTFFSA
jgi:hypothetical protein